MLELCAKMEQEQPSTTEHFRRLTHHATEQINDLAEEFEDNDSELETVARDVMARCSADYRSAPLEHSDG